ncbi:hypothetical protein GGTG_10418 [Gaeumannomyces tritici R3-111a-1]|uniref:Uncharacterized protein n=1 Tax=Gaeumannomyces tritici (strain R3-111a-1) TaxID=644352 RepID=J3PA92_GAET3|nr:hypothetical protein GGTG_10418 [Gaeumannomyces tritici R3-111a-1]EJT71158.1 hypothetical protein GGTG_10418 [Gaeumannomyces tritici R3-111a-1]
MTPPLADRALHHARANSQPQGGTSGWRLECAWATVDLSPDLSPHAPLRNPRRRRRPLSQRHSTLPGAVCGAEMWVGRAVLQEVWLAGEG